MNGWHKHRSNHNLHSSLPPSKEKSRERIMLPCATSLRRQRRPQLYAYSGIKDSKVGELELTSTNPHTQFTNGALLSEAPKCCHAKLISRPQLFYSPQAQS